MNAYMPIIKAKYKILTVVSMIEPIRRRRAHLSSKAERTRELDLLDMG